MSSTGMRRVRRAGAGAAAFDEAVSDSNSVASDKYGKFNAARANVDEQLPLLSEKLRQQDLVTEQQTQIKNKNNDNRRGPMMDSDHFGMPNKKKSQAAPSSGNSIGSLQRMRLEMDAPKGGERGRPPPLQRRKMNLVYSSFGDTHRILRRVKNVMKCSKDEDDDDLEAANPVTNDTNAYRPKKLKVVFLMILIVLVVFSMGRRKGRNIEEEKESLSSSTLYNQTLRGISAPNLQVQASSINMESVSKSNNISQTSTLQVVFPSYFSSLSNLTEEYRPDIETPYFWDVHFSGESVAEAVFSNCLNLIMAAEFGFRQPNYSEDMLATFIYDGGRYVNVELNTKEGILRASTLGLAKSRLADVIISPYLHNMASSIFTKENPGRIFSVFRHPVQRALANYHYLSKATWDPMYAPELKNMTIEEFAKSKYIENNWVTRFLVDKTKGKLTHSDMLLAKMIVRYKVLVGLYDELDTSMARFQRYFGWKDTSKTRADIAICRSKTVARGDKNVLGHPTSIEDGKAVGSLQSNNSAVEEVLTGTAAWKSIERHNLFDIELYEFAKKVYALQGKHIFDVVGM